MHKIATLVLLFLGTVSTFRLNNIDINTAEVDIEENDPETTEILAEEYSYNGFKVVEHQVYTEDGYSIAVHRIQSNGPPVLIMHGLLGSSQNFLAFGNEKSLAYSLAEQGYDVWIGNNRGNTYSRKHRNYDPDNSTVFWDFSFHEMGYYDCASIIDYIGSNFNKSNITYIGHAQGVTQFFVLAATKPEYNKVISRVIALSPFAYMSHIPHPVIRLLKDQKSILELLASFFKINEFLAHNDQITKVLKLACWVGPLSKYCSLIPYILGGMNPQPLERSMTSTFLDNFPAGTSLKNIKHLLQQVASGNFQQYDYGLIGNMNHYNQTAPPLYNLSNVLVPVTIFHAQNDWLASEQDINKLTKELPNSEKVVIKSKYFNHYDFFMGKDVYPLVNFPIVNMVNIDHGRVPLTSTSKPQTTSSPSPSSRSTKVTNAPTSTTSTSGSTKITNSSTKTPTTPKPNSGVSFKFSLILYIVSVISILIR